MLIMIFILIGVPGLIVLIDFLSFLFTGDQVINKIVLKLTELASLIILPLLYGGFGAKNDCCDDDSAVFSPDHQLSIGIVIILCLAAYFYSSYRIKITSPVVEIIVNVFLLIGIILNGFIAVHTRELWLAVGGNLPIILLTILAIAKNHRIFVEHSQELSANSENRFEKFAWGVLNLKPILRYPIIFILCLPVLTILVLLLLLVGQKPDSLIRAFTDTYKHGLSQWDYKCDNIQCGGHYLCSVAAKGHKNIVKPKRFGVRNGGRIICNRQLLVSNAFEELVQEKVPIAHRLIRKQYDKVGRLIHRYYGVFNIKLISDFIYVLMKPLEWFFLLVLYTFDRKPENRIAKQYLSSEDRQLIDRI